MRADVFMHMCMMKASLTKLQPVLEQQLQPQEQHDNLFAKPLQHLLCGACLLACLS
jgi:hypothetical protein